MTTGRPARRSIATVAMAAFALALPACGGEAVGDGLDDAAVTALAEEVLDGLDLPGEPRSVRLDAPEGELVFGFHCPIGAAGLDVDSVLVDFPSPRSVIRELEGGGVEVVDVSALVFDSPASASNVLSAYDAEANVECFSDYFDAPATIEAVDGLDIAGVTAEGFVISAPTTATEEGGPVSFAVVQGRVLLDVTVFAPDTDRGRSLAEPVLADALEALRAGGA